MTKPRIPLLSLLAVSLLGALLIAPSISSAAAGKAYTRSGVINACFDAKGADQGDLRIVRPKQRCHRGERRVKWTAAGKSGPAGQKGADGKNGANGVNGSDGAQGPVDATLKALINAQKLEIDELTTRLKDSEDLLNGVAANASKLSGITLLQLESTVANASKLAGFTGAQVTEALGAALASVPQIEALCDQTEVLSLRSNALLSALGGIALNGVIPINLGLTIPSLPVALGPFACD